MVYSFRKAKISNFEITVVNKYVLRFNISMHKIVVVKYFITIAKLFEEKPYLIFTYLIVGVEHKLIQVTSIAVFHDEVEVVLT